jgi:hypothetical protein
MKPIDKILKEMEPTINRVDKLLKNPNLGNDLKCIDEILEINRQNIDALVKLHRIMEK